MPDLPNDPDPAAGEDEPAPGGPGIPSDAAKRGPERSVDSPDADPAEEDGSGSSPDEPAQTRKDRVLGFADRHVPLPTTVPGFLVVLIIVGALGTVAALAGAAFQKFSETAGFCSQCHTMAAEVAANRQSVHRDVSCGECHVEPGIIGLVKSKLRGSLQLLEVVTDTYPEPILEPDHNLLPPTRETCMKCHTMSSITKEGRPTKLILHNVYKEDAANTKDTVALMVRPYRLGEGKSVERGAHWHVEDKVEYATPETDAQTINWIKVTYKNGKVEEFIARSQVGVSADVEPDIKRLLKTEKIQTMNCISCHNRAGHEMQTPNEAIDSAMEAGEISSSLPYIKRQSVELLGKNYKSDAEAYKAIEGIRATYALNYPHVAVTRAHEINDAVHQLKIIYHLVANPEMKEIAADYPNNLGHQNGPGCFRCHDGAHFAVASSGRLLKKTVPWECTTCHTFPQQGKTVTSLAVMAPPPDHLSPLWVFNHSSLALAIQPSSNSAFCANCHGSGLSKVSHDEMLYHHPAEIEKAGLQECFYCHQQAFCERCHKPGATGAVKHDSIFTDEVEPLVTGKLE